jgi:hypothetical protein
MSDDPYKIWFSVQQEFAGDDVARSLEDAGCSF